MTDADKTIYKICREQAGYTQERAAELLNCSVRQLARYEAGEVQVPDDLAYAMVRLYNSQYLAVEHLRLVSQLAALHSYEEVKLAVIFPKEEYGQWEWMRWLPHTFNDSRSFRYMACTSYETSQLLKQLNGECRGRKKDHGDFFGKMEPAIPHYVLISPERKVVDSWVGYGEGRLKMKVRRWLEE